MSDTDLDIVTGAFGYTGRYITHLLLSEGGRVRTLTGHRERPNPFGDRLEVAPFNFDRPDELAKSLKGARSVINTYWVRFSYGGVTYDRAVENTRTLIRAAARAGVRRFVHVSITNPSEDSPLPYFRGKAILERELKQSGLSHAIIRPTVIFGPEDILINNIAWLLRRFPLFAVPGSGDYGIQPIFVEDMAELTVAAARDTANVVIDAVGPEVFAFKELVALLAKTVGSRARVIHVAPELALTLSRVVGWLTRDVTLTRDEVRGLMANLLVASGPPTGSTRLSEWLAHNAHLVGATYASELARHFK
jgi:NADH dehydrogenase